MIIHLVEGVWCPTIKAAQKRREEVGVQNPEIKFPRIESYDLGTLNRELLCDFLNQLTRAVDVIGDGKEDPRA